jgi:hypothetical protein
MKALDVLLMHLINIYNLQKKEGLLVYISPKTLILIFLFNFSFCKLKVYFFQVLKVIQKKNIVIEGIV